MLPLLGRGNIEVTCYLRVTSMLPVETRPNIAEALCTKAFPSAMLPLGRFSEEVMKNPEGDVKFLNGAAKKVNGAGKLQINLVFHSICTTSETTSRRYSRWLHRPLSRLGHSNEFDGSRCSIGSENRK